MILPMTRSARTCSRRAAVSSELPLWTGRPGVRIAAGLTARSSAMPCAWEALPALLSPAGTAAWAACEVGSLSASSLRLAPVKAHDRAHLQPGVTEEAEKSSHTLAALRALDQLANEEMLAFQVIPGDRAPVAAVEQDTVSFRGGAQDVGDAGWGGRVMPQAPRTRRLASAHPATNRTPAGSARGPALAPSGLGAPAADRWP
jgi:hypothetical protein